MTTKIAIKKREFIRDLESLIKQGRFEEFEMKFKNRSDDIHYEKDSSFALTLVEQLAFKQTMNEDDFSEEYCVHLVELCLEYGENLNIFSNPSTKKTLLMLAVEHDLEGIVDLIITHPTINLEYMNNCYHADSLDNIGDRGIDALNYAIIYGKNRIFKKLYNKIFVEQQIEMTEERYCQILGHSISSSNLEVIKFVESKNIHRPINPFFIQDEARIYQESVIYSIGKILKYFLGMRAQNEFSTKRQQEDLAKLKYDCQQKTEIFTYFSEDFIPWATAIMDNIYNIEHDFF
jgi:hypothetical protein